MRSRWIRAALVMVALVVGGSSVAVVASGASSGVHVRRALSSRRLGPVPLPAPTKADLAAGHSVTAVRVHPLTARLVRVIARDRRAYRVLSASAAAALARRGRFGALSEARTSFYEPLMLRPGERLVRFINAHEAEVSTPRSRTARLSAGSLPHTSKLLFAQSTAPMFVVHDGQKRTVSLDLHAIAGGGLAPMVASTPVRFANGSVAFPGVDVSAALVGASKRPVENLGEEGFEPSALLDTDLVDQATVSGAEQWLQLRSPASPDVFRFRLALPTGAFAQSQPDGRIMVFSKTKSALMEIPPPVANDALGNPVQTSFSVQGNTLVLSVEHRLAGTAYPVSVDPVFLTSSPPNVQDPYNYVDQETPNGSGSVITTGSPELFKQWGYFTSSGAGQDFVHTLNPASAPSGEGEQFVTATGQSPPVGSYAEMVYEAPAGAYINRVDFDATYHSATSASSSTLVEGIAYGAYPNIQWENESAADNAPGATPTTNIGVGPYYVPAVRSGGAQAISVNTSVAPAHDGNYAIFGLEELKTGARTASAPDAAYFQGATVWLYDNIAPTWTSAAPASSLTWTDDGAATHTTTVVAADTGLGMKTFTLNTFNTQSQALEATQGVTNPCSGDHTGNGYCPASWQTTLNYQLPDGRDTLIVQPGDVLNNIGPNEGWSVLIDRSPPTVSMTGALANVAAASSSTAPLTGNSYPLDIAATDGDSGVEEIDVSVDGGTPITYPGNCITQSNTSTNTPAGCDTAENAQFVFNPNLYAAGHHTITVTARDWLGTSKYGQPNLSSHVSASQSISFYSQPQLAVSAGQPSEQQNDTLGVERFYDYHSIDTGVGSTFQVNEGTGNGVWSWSPIQDAGQGLDSDVTLTYNSQARVSDSDVSTSIVGGKTITTLTSGGYDQIGAGWSVAVDGLTRLNDPLNLSQAALGEITFTDPTGAQHTFLKSSSGQWIAPPGLFMHLRPWLAPGATSTDFNKAWAITTPDGTTYFYDGLGYESGIQDRVGNEITFQRTLAAPGNATLAGLTKTLCQGSATTASLAALNSALGLVGTGCAEQTSSVIDQGGRRIAINYTTVNGAQRIGSIIDHAGHVLQFGYDSTGTQLTTVTQAYGQPDARAFKFGYTTGQPPAISLVSSLLDDANLPNIQGSLFPQSLNQITDPQGASTYIAYEQPTNSQSSAPCPAAATGTALNQLVASIADLEPLCVHTIEARDGGTTTLNYNQTASSCVSGDECTEVTGPQTDANGNPENWFDSLDTSLRPVQTVDPLGRETTTTWNSLAGNPAWDTTGTNAPNTVAQQVSGQVASGFSNIQALVTCSQYSYDVLGDITDDQGPTEGGPITNGSCPSAFRETKYSYKYSPGPAALVSQTGDSGGQFVEFLSQQQVAGGPTGLETTSYTADPNDPNDGLVYQVTDPDGQVWSTQYYKGVPDGSSGATPSTDFGGGLILSQTDPAGNTTSYGNAEGQYNALSTLGMNNGYDPSGQPMLVYAPGQTSTPTTYQYDEDGNVIVVTDPRNTSPSLIPGSNQPSPAADPVVSQTNVTQPFSRYYRYDDLDEETESWTPKDTAVGSSNTWLIDQAGYDHNGNVLQTVVGDELVNSSLDTGADASPTTTNFTYTAMDQQASKQVTGVPATEASTAGGSTQTTTYCYDHNGDKTDEVLPAGQSSLNTSACVGGISAGPTTDLGTTHAVHYIVDADGDDLVMQQIAGASTGTQTAQQQVTSYAYDAQGNEIASADPSDNLGISWTAAENNALTAVQNKPGQWRTRTSYDAAGEAIENIENPGITTSGGPLYWTSFNQYDAAGNLIGSESAKDQQTLGTLPVQSTSTGQYQLTGIPHVTAYSYTARNLLTSQSNPDQDTTVYGRDSDGRICWIMSPNGVAYQSAAGNNVAGQATNCTSALTSLPDTTAYTYTPQSWVKTIQLPKAPNEYSYPAGEMGVSYGYDLVGDPQSIADPDGHTITNTFYDSGDLKSTSDPWWWTTGSNGASPDPNDGSSGQLSAATPGAGLAVQQLSLQSIMEGNDQASSSSPSLPSDGISGQLGQVPAESLPGVLPSAGQTQFGYDGQMRLTAVAGAEAVANGSSPALTTTMSYDADGNMTRLSQPMDGTSMSVTSYQYDPDGNQISVTSPARATVATSPGSALSQTSAAGAARATQTTTSTYDGLDRLSSVVAPGAASSANAAATADTTTYCYYLDPTLAVSSGAVQTGCPTDSGNPTGALQVGQPGNTSSAIAQRVLTIDPAGHSSTQDYDGEGKLIASTDSLGNETSYAYDAIGDQTSASRPLGAQPGGPTLTATTPTSGYTTQDSYDQAGRLSTSTDGAGNPSTYGYDADGNLTQQTLPGAANSSSGSVLPEVTQYTYNGRDLLWSTTTGAESQLNNADNQQDERTTVTETDGDGNVVRTVNPAGVNPLGSVYYPYSQDYPNLTSTGTGTTTTSTTTTGTSTTPTSSQTDADADANIDATINTYDSSNQITASYLPWGCDLGANSTKPTTASGFCNDTETTDPRRWEVQYSRTSPSQVNGDWIASVTNAYQWATGTSAASTTPQPTTTFSYNPNGWIQGQSTSYPDLNGQSANANPGPDGSSQSFTYTYDAAGDQTKETEVGTSSAAATTNQFNMSLDRTLNRSYWPDGQPQQVYAQGTGKVADHSIDYYWNPTGTLGEIDEITPAQTSTQDNLCYDADSRLQAVYGSVPVNGTANTTDTFYAYDGDSNLVGQITNANTAFSNCSSVPPQGSLPNYNGTGQQSSFAYTTLDQEQSMQTQVASTTAQEPQRNFTTTYWPSGAPETQTRYQTISGTKQTPINENWYYNDNGQESTDSTTSESSSGSNLNQTFSYDTDANATQTANGTHLYNALDQEVQWTRGGYDTANSTGTDVGVDTYMYDGDGALMQETTSVPGVSTTQLGLPVTASQNTTTIYCSNATRPTPSQTPTAQSMAASPSNPDCQLDNGRSETIETYATENINVGGMQQPITNNEATQSECYNSLGQLRLEDQVDQGCGTGTTPTATTSSSYGINVFGQQVSSSVPYGTGTLNTTTTYDALGRADSQNQSVNGAAAPASLLGYVGLSDSVSFAQGTTPTGTQYNNAYDYNSSGAAVGLYTNATNGGAYYSYLRSPTGSVEGLEGTNGSVGTSDEYHYTPDGELELGANQINATGNQAIANLLGNEPVDSALSSEAQANQLTFDSYFYNPGSPPGGSNGMAGLPGTDSYTTASRQYVPGNDAYTSPDSFESGAANAVLSIAPGSQDAYAFDAGNPTTRLDGDGHLTNGLQSANGDDSYMPVQGSPGSGSYHLTTTDPSSGQPAATNSVYSNGHLKSTQVFSFQGAVSTSYGNAAQTVLDEQRADDAINGLLGAGLSSTLGEGMSANGSGGFLVGVGGGLTAAGGDAAGGGSVLGGPVLGLLTNPFTLVGALAAGGGVGLAVMASGSERDDRSHTSEGTTTTPTPLGQIHISEEALDHIEDRHLPSGDNGDSASQFFPDADIDGLIHEAEGTQPEEQANGRDIRVVSAPDAVGLDASTGKYTNTYTVVTEKNGDLVTAFPGIPKGYYAP